MPRPGGACSSYLLRAGQAAVLVDIGSGSVGKLQTVTDLQQLDAIVVTHMHADHFLDLVPLRYGRKHGPSRLEAALPLWLPPGGRAVLAAVGAVLSPDNPNFFGETFDVREYDESEVLTVEDLSLSFRRTRHYIPAFAVRAHCGGTSIVYSADTAPCEAVVEHARHASVFLCEAALGLSAEEGERGHSSAIEAGEMAERAGVRRLLITHYASGVDPQALADAAATRFRGPITIAYDGLEVVA